MKEFDKAIITKNGNELIAEAIAGKKIEFTRLITGCGIYGESEELECAAALKEEKQEFPFSVNEKISENGVLLTAVISNVGLEAGYRLTEIGIGGKLQDSEEEILYAINITGEEKAYFLPPYNGLEATEIELSCYITIKQDAELKMALGDVVDMMLNELRKENARAITAEKELKGSLNILTENLAEEITRATTAEEELAGSLNALTESLTEAVTRATAAEEELKGNLTELMESLTEEVTRATTAEEELEGSLTALTESLTEEVTRATTAEEELAGRLTALTESLTEEVARATVAEEELEGSLTALTESLTEEVTRATATEEELEGSLTALTESLTEEVTRATATEEELEGNLTALTESLTEEVTRATTTEEELEGNLTALTESLTEEVTRATAAEEELEGNLTALTESLTEEVARATAAEEELNNRIDFILRNKEILNFNENNECVIEDERITADSLADVYFTSDTISIATDAVITVETYSGNVKLSCQNAPAGAIKASIKIKVV